MQTTIPDSHCEFLEPCFSTPFSPSAASTDESMMDADSLLKYFDQFPLPFPVSLAFNSEEREICRTIGDILHKYFSLGYRYGAIEHFQNLCKVTQVAPNKFLFSGLGEHIGSLESQSLTPPSQE